MNTKFVRAFVFLVVAAYLSLFLMPLILYQDLRLPPDPYTSLINTVLSASIATALGFPLAVFLAFYAIKRGLGGVLPLVTFTTAVPHTAVGLLLLPIFSRLGLVDTVFAVVFSMLFVSLPIGVGSMASIFSSAEKSLDEFLRPLGLNDMQIIWLHVRGAVIGTVTSAALMWLRCFSELGAFLIVANRPLTVGVYLLELFNRGGASLSIIYAVVVGLIGLIFSVVLYLLSRRTEGV